MLTQERRTQLDSIVQKMVDNKESEGTIQLVVGDFVKKYNEEQQKPSLKENVIGFGKGFAKRTASTLQNVGNVVAQPINTAFNKALGTDNTVGFSEEQLALNTPAEKVGGIASDLATFIAPGVGVTKVAKGAQAAVAGASTASKVLGLGARAAVEGIGSGATTLAQEGDTKSAIDSAIIGAAFPLAGAAFKKGLGLTEKAAKSFAPRLVNSLIKPLAKDLSYGKNPGRAVAEEGIVARSLDELGTKINETLTKRNAELANKLKSASKIKLNLANVLTPIDDAIEAAKAAPRTNSQILSRLEAVKNDILGVQIDETGKEVATRILKGVSPEQARELKQLVGELTRFTGAASDDKAVNLALKRVYGQIKQSINDAVPGVANLNERIADLVSAKVATEYRDKILERQNLIKIGEGAVGLGAGTLTAYQTGDPIQSVAAGLGAAGIRRALGSPAFKTAFAAKLAALEGPARTSLFADFPWLKAIVIESFVGE